MQKFSIVKKETGKMLYFIAGNLFYAFGVQLFLATNGIAAGGFSGIAIVLSRFIPLTIGSFIFLLNIPFLFIAVFVKGKRYAAKTLLGSAIYSAILEAISLLPAATHNMLVAAVFGGLLYGVGAVLILKSEASGGGTDLVARLLKSKFPSVSLGKMFLLVDGSVVIFAMVMFRDIEAGLYAIITIYVCSIVNDRILQGFDRASMCYIITDNNPAILYQEISKELGRSVTLQHGVGMYQGNERNILMTVLRPKETWTLKRIVSEHDPSAFVVMANATEVIGRGFKGVLDETPPDALELPHKKHTATV